EAPTLLEPERRSDELAAAKGCAGGAERTGDDDPVSGLRAAAAGNARGAPDRRHREDDLRRRSRVAAANGHACLGDACVELEDVVDVGLAGQGQRDDEAVRG